MLQFAIRRIVRHCVQFRDIEPSSSARSKDLIKIYDNILSLNHGAISSLIWKKSLSQKTNLPRCMEPERSHLCSEVNHRPTSWVRFFFTQLYRDARPRKHTVSKDYVVFPSGFPPKKFCFSCPSHACYIYTRLIQFNLTTRVIQPTSYNLTLPDNNNVMVLLLSYT